MVAVERDTTSQQLHICYYHNANSVSITFLFNYVVTTVGAIVGVHMEIHLIFVQFIKSKIFFSMYKIF